MTASIRTFLMLGLAPLAIAVAQGQTPPTPPVAAPAPPVLAPMAPTPPVLEVFPSLTPLAQFDEERARAIADEAAQAVTLRIDEASIRDITAQAREMADQARSLTFDATPYARSLADYDMQLGDLGARLAPLSAFDMGLPNGGPRAPWIQGDPADSVYQAARQALNRGDYRSAAREFESCRTKYTNSRYVADCGYWQAFSLYRLGSMEDLKAAGAALDAISSRTADLSRQNDVPGLRTRINSALALRGDAQAADELRKAAQAGTAPCDKEDVSVRAEALSTLSQMDEEAVLPTFRSVLSRKDDCSIDLRRQAIVLLARRSDTTAAAILSQVAKSDPSKDIQQTAVQYLGRLPGAMSFNTLEDLLKSSTDEDMQGYIVDALGQNADPRANQALRAFLERGPSDRLQVHAISAISGDNAIRIIGGRLLMPGGIAVGPVYASRGAAAASKAAADAGGVGAVAPVARGAAASKPMTYPETYTVVTTPAVGRGAGSGRGRGSNATRPADDNEAFLREFYPKAKSELVKEAVVAAVASYNGDKTQSFLLGVAENTSESSSVRGYALGRVGMNGAPIADLGKLYDGADSRNMREQLITVFGARTEPEASDKLFEIIKLGTDPDLRNAAIRALASKKNDPRAAKLLNDLVAGRGGI